MPPTDPRDRPRRGCTARLLVALALAALVLLAAVVIGVSVR